MDPNFNLSLIISRTRHTPSTIRLPGRPLQPATRPRSAQAWDLFHRFASGIMRALVRKHGLSRDEVDDVLQEAWLVIYARLPGLNTRQMSGLSAWLRSIVRNKTVDQLRRRCHRADSLDAVLSGERHPVDPRSDPALLLEKVGNRELVFAILAKMENNVSMLNLILFRLRYGTATNLRHWGQYAN